MWQGCLRVVVFLVAVSFVHLNPVKAEQARAVDAVGDYGFLMSLGRLTFMNNRDVYEWTHKCAGSLIRTEYPAMILTAGHCVHWPGFDSEGATIGDTGYNQYYVAFTKEFDWIHPQRTIIARVKRVDFPNLFRHRTATKEKPAVLMGDIAVLTIDMAAPAEIQPSHLFSFDAGSFIDMERQVQIFGWGYRELNENDGGQQLLGMKEHFQYADRPLKEGDKVNMLGTSVVKLTALKQCRQVLGIYFKNLLEGEPRKPMVKNWLNIGYEMLKTLIDLAWVNEDKPVVKTVKRDELCAWDTREEFSSCNGDSGAPLVFYHDMNDNSKNRIPMVIGITSGSLTATCDASLPVVFTSVPYWQKWIHLSVQCTLQLVHDTFDDPAKFAAYLNRTNQDFDRMIERSEQLKWGKNLAHYVNAKSGAHMATVKAFKLTAAQMEEEPVDWCAEKDELEQQMAANATVDEAEDSCGNVIDACPDPTECFEASYKEATQNQTKEISVLKSGVEELLDIASELTGIDFKTVKEKLTQKDKPPSPVKTIETKQEQIIIEQQQQQSVVQVQPEPAPKPAPIPAPPPKPVAMQPPNPPPPPPPIPSGGKRR